MATSRHHWCCSTLPISTDFAIAMSSAPESARYHSQSKLMPQLLSCYLEKGRRPLWLLLAAVWSVNGAGLNDWEVESLTGVRHFELLPGVKRAGWIRFPSRFMGTPTTGIKTGFRWNRFEQLTSFAFNFLVWLEQLLFDKIIIDPISLSHPEYHAKWKLATKNNQITKTLPRLYASLIN